MSTHKKRSYNSDHRKSQAKKTKNTILVSAKKLFESKGFDAVTIEEIAAKSGVSISMVFTLFETKCGVLRALLDHALSQEQFETLVQKVKSEKSLKKQLDITANIARQIYDAESKQMDLLRGVSFLDPALKKLEMEMEERRYHRQKETVIGLASEKTFPKGLTLAKARDIFWTFTGRDIYRMLVRERGWSSDEYEKWLAEILQKMFLNESN